MTDLAPGATVIVTLRGFVHDGTASDNPIGGYVWIKVPGVGPIQVPVTAVKVVG